MAETESDPYGPIKDAWGLYQTMTEELAEQYAHDVFNERTVSDTWGNLAGEIAVTKTALYEYAGPGATRKERREHRHERREIEGLNEILDQTHESLVNLGNAEVDYLKLEEQAKQAMAAGGTPDASSLELARSQVARSRETLRQSRSTLSYRIENLADETGSGLFTPN